MARPRTGERWLEVQRRARLTTRIARFSEQARARQLTLFKGEDGRLLAIAGPGNYYERQRMRLLENIAEQIGVYGPGAEDFGAMMLDDCKAAGLL